MISNLNCIFILAFSLALVFGAENKKDNSTSIEDNNEEERNEAVDYYEYSNEITDDFTQDDKNNLTTGTTDLPYSSVTDFSYTYTKNTLNVSFVLPKLGWDYVLFLIPINNGDPIRKNLRASKLLEVVRFGRNDVKPYRNYTVEIYKSPYYRDETPLFKSKTFYLEAYKTSSLDCNRWQMNIGLKCRDWEHSCTASFEPKPEFATCFQSYIVVLYNFRDELCQTDSTVHKGKTVTYDNKTMTVTFDELPPGNYCVIIIGKHSFCPYDTQCIGRRNEDGEELKEFKEDIAILHLQKKNENSNVVAIIVPSCAVILIMIVGLFGAIKKFADQQKLMYYVSTITSSPAKAPSNILNCKEGLILRILHAQDDDRQQKVAIALHNFLQECCHAKSIIAENNAEVLLNSSTWIQNNFSYKFSKNIKDKIVILETNAAVKLYQAWHKREKLNYKRHCYLNDLFIRGLNQLTSSPGFDGTDHHHIVVIHFSYFDESNKLDHFGQKRLCLPHQLVQLFNSIWDKNDLIHEEENLLNEWEEKNSYKELLRAIEEMDRYVKKNPNYLDEYVFGDSIVV